MSKSPERIALEKQGWTFRSVQEKAKIIEMTEEYEEIGFAVKTLPWSDGDCGECTTCFEDNRDNYKSLFTRPVGSKPDSQE